jgi:hypothetical protein
MSDDKLHDRLTRAARAQEIVESDLFKEATQTIERDLIAAWKLTPLRNTEDRERLWQAVQLIGKMSEFFLAAISDGKIAKRQLDELTPKPKKESAESAPPATAETKLSDEDNAAPLEEATGETEEDAPAQEPPRDLPRSWTKDRTEHWAKLDPATQDFLLEQDRKASAEVRRVQNEAAEKLKA